jgi:uncharacterized protein (TIGR02646 family)
MKRVNKGMSPQRFENWKSNGRKTWSQFKNKTNIKNLVKENLLEDQGYICCYCGKRIELDEMTTIEHFLPKGLPRYSHLALDYQNLFVSCNGGREERYIQACNNEVKTFPLSCDSKKGEEVLPFGPLSAEYESLVRYSVDGRVTDMTNNGDGAKMIQVLGIGNDNANLVNNRRKAIKPWIENLPSTDEIQLIINHYETKMNGRYEEYCFVVKQILEEFS